MEEVAEGDNLPPWKRPLWSLNLPAKSLRWRSFVMARKPIPTRPQAARRPVGAAGSETTGSHGQREGDPVVAALMGLLAEKPIEQIGFAEISARAGISLAELHERF